MQRHDSLTRRSILGKAMGFGVAAVAVTIAGTVGSVASAHHTEQPYKTTAALNLRKNPSSSSSVILVMPKGATVYLMQRFENGYYFVTYKGQLGWAHRDYIVAAGQPHDPVVIGNRVAKQNLNVRSGPSTSNQVLDVLDKGATVSITDQVRNGYRYILQHSGPAGWVLDSGLGTGGQPSGTLKATANLNLRDQPSTRARVLLVIPAGATVRAGDQRANGFRQVTYNGKAGWASEAYLR